MKLKLLCKYQLGGQWQTFTDLLLIVTLLVCLAFLRLSRAPSFAVAIVIRVGSNGFLFFLSFRCFLSQKFQALLVGTLREKLVTDTLTGLAKTLAPVKSLIGRLLCMLLLLLSMSVGNFLHCFFCFVTVSMVLVTYFVCRFLLLDDLFFFVGFERCGLKCLLVTWGLL